MDRIIPKSCPGEAAPALPAERKIYLIAHLRSIDVIPMTALPTSAVGLICVVTRNAVMA